jgi:protein-S-isoprenylcysteine O-methyltransferase Ste14
MNFQASEIEFRHRFWFIAAIFSLGFMCYWVDPENISLALSKIIVNPANRKSLDMCARGFLIFGALLALAAALIRTWAGSYLHSSVVHDMNLHLDRLVADGPYRYLRNPLYLGTILLAAGMGFLASRIGFIILAGGMTFFTYRLIFREEASLLASQKEDYRRYFQNVPRLIPLLKPIVLSAGSQPNWIDGFMGEIFIWACAIGMTLFAATENIYCVWIAMGISFAIRFLRAFTGRNSVQPSSDH